MICLIWCRDFKIHPSVVWSSFFLTKSSAHQMMRKALCLYQTPWGVSWSAIQHHKSVQLCNKNILSPLSKAQSRSDPDSKQKQKQVLY